MAIPTSTKSEINSRVRADVQSKLPDVNPFLDATLLVAILNGVVGRLFDINLQLNQIQPKLFPTTTDIDFARMWGALLGIAQKAPSKAQGPVTFVGTDGAQVAINAILNTLQGTQYQLLDSVNIEDQKLQITNLTRVGNTAFATTASPHQLATSVPVTITGANQPDYNVTAAITVTSPTDFNYPISNNPATPATGSIYANFTTGVGDVISIATGKSANLAGGTALTLSTPFAGVNDTAVAQFEGISGGSDEESIDAYEARYLEEFRNPNTPFNAANIAATAKAIAGVTRVFVFPITPSLGQVTVYFTRDNDDSIIPTPSEVEQVSEAIELIMPANMSPDYLFVLAPTPKTVNFTFSSITPDTLSMRTAVADSLDAFFRHGTAVGKNLEVFEYESVIFNTIDPQTGNQVETFTLLEPTGQIAVLNNEIPVLGNVNFT